MAQVLQYATSVGTPLALLGLFAALAFYAYSRHLKHDEKKLESLPSSERAAAIDRYLSRYNIGGENLSAAAKERLILREMENNYNIAQTRARISAGVFVICFLAAVFTYIFRPTDDPPPHPLRTTMPARKSFHQTRSAQLFRPLK